MDIMDRGWHSSPTNFLANLNLQDRQDFFRLGNIRSYRRDELIFQEGSSSDEIFLLLEGRVKVFELSKEGREMILWFCFPGELFGLAEVMQKNGREVSAQASKSVEVLAIKTLDFQRYIKQHSQLALRVIELLGYRLRELSDVLLDLASDDVTSRVIKLLTRLCSRYGKRIGNDILLDIALTHQEMADMIGASRQTVTSVLSALRKQGVLKMQQRLIYIQDTSWLEKIVGKLSYPQPMPIHLHCVHKTA